MAGLRRNPAYTKRSGNVAIEDPTLVLSDPAELARHLLARFGDPRYDPPRLPEVATRLLELDRRGDVDTSAVIALLEQDAMLSGRILRVVQSPLYAGRMPIRSLRNAVVRMGLTTVRNTVMEVVMEMRVLRAPEPIAASIRQLAVHLRATAHAARAIARHTAFDAELAFLCGLLHDIGTEAALTTLAELLPTDRKVTSWPLLWGAIDDIHCRASERICRLWDLPDEVAQVIGNHHTTTIAGYVHPLAAIICVAEHLAGEFGAPASTMTADDGTLRFDQSAPARLEGAIETLAFSDAVLDTVLGEVQGVVELVLADTRR